jgi:hypothetical protein
MTRRFFFPFNTLCTYMIKGTCTGFNGQCAATIFPGEPQKHFENCSFGPCDTQPEIPAMASHEALLLGAAGGHGKGGLGEQGAHSGGYGYGYGKLRAPAPRPAGACAPVCSRAAQA